MERLINHCSFLNLLCTLMALLWLYSGRIASACLYQLNTLANDVPYVLFKLDHDVSFTKLKHKCK